MNIYTVRDNLRNTIAGKEKHLEAIRKEMAFIGRRDDETIAMVVTAEFIAVNIDELKRILADVEQCCENATAASWAGSVDRQGGAFEDFETRNRDGWIEP